MICCSILSTKCIKEVSVKDKDKNNESAIIYQNRDENDKYFAPPKEKVKRRPSEATKDIYLKKFRRI